MGGGGGGVTGGSGSGFFGGGGLSQSSAGSKEEGIANSEAAPGKLGFGDNGNPGDCGDASGGGYYGGRGTGSSCGAGDGGSSYSSGLILSNQQDVKSGHDSVIFTINSCSLPYYLSGGLCGCTASYSMSGGAYTMRPVGSCCLYNLTAVASWLGSTAQGAAALAGKQQISSTTLTIF